MSLLLLLLIKASAGEGRILFSAEAAGYGDEDPPPAVAAPDLRPLEEESCDRWLTY